MGLLGDRNDTLLKQIAEDEIVKPIERLEGVSAVRILGGDGTPDQGIFNAR